VAAASGTACAQSALDYQGAKRTNTLSPVAGETIQEELSTQLARRNSDVSNRRRGAWAATQSRMQTQTERTEPLWCSVGALPKMEQLPLLDG